MAEVLGNSPSEPTATLVGGISSGATSMTVSGWAAPLPQTGNFRLRIGDELILIGAVSGATLSSLTRGVESTIAAAHSNGDDVNLVTTAGGLAAYVSGRLSIKIVDLGVIHIPTLILAGATTLYEMAAGEFLASVRFTDTDFETTGPGSINDGIFDSLYFGIGTAKSMGWWGFLNAAGAPIHGADIFVDTTGLYVNGQAYGPRLSAVGYSAQILSAAAGGPVKAAFFTSDKTGSGLMLGGISAWAVNTHYGAGTDFTNPASTVIAAVLANGTIWLNTGAAGTSGGSSPDFAGNAGGSVADGPNIVWSDSVLVPFTTGAVHAVAEIWTPA